MVPYEEIDRNTVNIAETYYYELFKACEEDCLNAFAQKEYLTPQFSSELQTGKYKDLCPITMLHAGEITSIQLIEAVYFKSVFSILRYKLTGTQLSNPIEFRITLTTDNKFANIQFFEWFDAYNSRLDELDWFWSKNQYGMKLQQN